MGDGVGSDVPTEVDELAHFVPGHAVREVVTIGIEPAGVDEEVSGVAVFIENIVNAASHRLCGVVEVEHDRAIGEGCVAVYPGIEIVVIDGGEFQFASDADQLIEVIGC